jgi:hypothetical protein
MPQPPRRSPPVLAATTPEVCHQLGSIVPSTLSLPLLPLLLLSACDHLLGLGGCWLHWLPLRQHAHPLRLLLPRCCLVLVLGVLMCILLPYQPPASPSAQQGPVTPHTSHPESPSMCILAMLLKQSSPAQAVSSICERAGVSLGSGCHAVTLPCGRQLQVF